VATFAPPAPPPYADWINRVGAAIIDGVAPAVLIIIGAVSQTAAVYFILLLAALAIQAYNRWHLGGTTGQSWGKKALHLKLISEETGEPIGMAMAFVRDICHIVDSVICYIGYLFPLWDAKRQTLADKIIKTVVITVPA
jgi:uncharacterized RDD family membrane protein YckC